MSSRASRASARSRSAGSSSSASAVTVSSSSSSSSSRTRSRQTESTKAGLKEVDNSTSVTEKEEDDDNEMKEEGGSKDSHDSDKESDKDSDNDGENDNDNDPAPPIRTSSRRSQRFQAYVEVVDNSTTGNDNVKGKDDSKDGDKGKNTDVGSDKSSDKDREKDKDNDPAPAAPTSFRRSQRVQALELQIDTTSSQKSGAQGNVDKAPDIEEKTKPAAPASNNKSKDNDDFMKSEHFPKLCSRVGSKYQAVIPAFDVEVAKAEPPPSPQDIPACIWSPNDAEQLCENIHSKSKEAVGGANERTDIGLLQRYLAQARLIMSKLYQTELDSHTRGGSQNILTRVAVQSKTLPDEGGMSDNDYDRDDPSPPQDTDSDFEGNLFEEDGSSDGYVSDEKKQSSRSRRRTNTTTKGRRRQRRVKSTRQRMKLATEKRGQSVRTTEPIVDGSFYMISSCIEDFLLELLHKCDYLPAKALHFLALITTPLPEVMKVEGGSKQEMDKKRKLNGEYQGTEEVACDAGDTDAASKRPKTANKLVKNEIQHHDSILSLGTECDNDDTSCIAPEHGECAVRAVEDTLNWVREVVDRSFCALSRDEQAVLGNAHSKSAYNLNKIIKSVPSDKRRVAINYAFRFLFVASDILQVELPSEEEIGNADGEGGESSPSSQNSSPRSSTGNTALNTNLGATEMVTRASMRLERKQKNKMESDIYYFPSPNEKGRYPMESSYHSRDVRGAKKAYIETIMTEQRALKLLIRMRGVLDNISFRQMMNSFSLFAEGTLSPIDMAVRLRYIFETFLDMNFPLHNTRKCSNLNVRGKLIPIDNAEDDITETSSLSDEVKPLNEQERPVNGSGEGTKVQDEGALTPERYIFNTKKLHNDFLVNFFPFHVAYWREMK